jgi:hypothetical protein
MTETPSCPHVQPKQDTGLRAIPGRYTWPAPCQIVLGDHCLRPDVHCQRLYILYLDESGKSGLKDPVQPYFVLGGVIVKHEDWRAIETYFERALEPIVPRTLRPVGWELHMVDIEYGKGYCTQVPRATRRKLCETALDVIEHFDLTVLVMVIDKRKMTTKTAWMKKPMDVWAYEFMVERYQHLLRRQQELGIVVGDEQKGTEALSRSQHAIWRRSGTSALNRVDRVIETVFFVPSHHSLMLQLADIVAYWANRAAKSSASLSVVPAQWTRIQRHLDTLNNGKQVGYKLWPP